MDVNGYFPAWSDLNTYIIESLGDFTPTEFNLNPAYPNPFNPITHIEYSVPYKTKISITIYDLVGREISNLVNEVQEPGYYDIKWDASLISSGMYFIRMQTNDFKSSQKVVLIK